MPKTLAERDAAAVLDGLLTDASESIGLGANVRDVVNLYDDAETMDEHTAAKRFRAALAVLRRWERTLTRTR